MGPPGDDPPVVLVVDDYEPNVVALEAVLAPLEYVIATADSGNRALEVLGERHVVLILMDVRMQPMDGYTTTARIRENPDWRDIPVVFLTGFTAPVEEMRRGYELGAADYIAKPYDADILRGKVRALVSLYTRGARAERARSEESARAKDLFLGALGHDLRNPLNAVLGSASLMLRKAGSGDGGDHEDARRILRAAQRMRSMIDDILDLTRKELGGGIELTREHTNLGVLCRTIIEEHLLTRPGREVTLDATGDVSGSWDATRLARVLSNLVGNALDHQPGAVEVRVRDEGQLVIIEVCNGGEPIDPRLLPVVFEPFRRSSGGGLGLGLHIVRELVLAHGGTVDVRSGPEGTTFRVILPRS